MLRKLIETLPQALPRRARETLRLRAFGFFRIPMLFFVSPKVVAVDDDRVVVEIALNRRTRNHAGSMYFAALAAGADCACGLLAVMLIEANARARGRVKLIFKDFHAEFLKRAEGNVHFICEQGREIREQVEAAAETGERQNRTIDVLAIVPALGSEPVARFKLTLSLKADSH
ncbi:MAG: DUF4442 domain-containing protein [Oligoflexia bacterium]|nr:DUF4442 domain-containing protein [Oligoflexia bacterium]